MKRLLSTFAVAGMSALFAVFTFAAAPAQAATRSDFGAISDFSAIQVSGPVDLVVRPAARESLRIDGDADLLSRLEVKVEERRGQRTLVIRLREEGFSFFNRDKLQASVEVVKLRRVASASSGKVDIEGLKTPALALALAGSGNAKLRQLDADSLALSIAGSGNVRADGRTRELSVDIAGSGNALLASLQADSASVSIAGSGNADVSADGSLSVSIAGSGNVRHAGKAVPRSSIVGSGTVRPR
ncbi:head GIN domain-containing protein [Rubrivivax gelatinosus]|uniref:head GIN domain-containing protein n=1 Tax=Rubrivivax gelatinosus TaxID=28068 RepID=UPI001F5B1151|nr:head GIN domain-containing protein [Rubrivivax gelatinosus]